MERNSARPAPMVNMDVYLFEVTKTAKGDPKLSKTLTVLHDVAQDCNVAGLKALIRSHQTGPVIYVPGNGLFWLRKGTKQLVQLKTEADFQNCKQEYNCKGKLQSIRIACASVNIDRPGLWLIIFGYYNYLIASMLM